jgi:ABC-type branched-subunit amino acid transport system permease subunit
MVAVVLCVTLLAAINLRRGATGRRWLAVRSNERAAAGVGISVRRAKLESFMLAGFIAGIGGTLLAYRRELVTADSFGVLDSIVVLSITFLAGIASPLGAVIAGALGAGGLLTVGMETLRPGSSDTQFAINGILLVVAAIRFRDGILGTAARRRPRRVADRLRQPGGAADATL